MGLDATRYNKYDLHEGAVSLEFKRELLLQLLQPKVDESKNSIEEVLRQVEPNLLATLEHKLNFKPSRDDKYSLAKQHDDTTSKNLEQQKFDAFVKIESYLDVIRKIEDDIRHTIILKEKIKETDEYDRKLTEEKEQNRQNNISDLNFNLMKEAELRILAQQIIADRLEYERKILLSKRSDLIEQFIYIQTQFNQLTLEAAKELVPQLKTLTTSEGKSVFECMDDEQIQAHIAKAIQNYHLFIRQEKRKERLQKSLRTEVNTNKGSRRNLTLTKDFGDKNNALQAFTLADLKDELGINLTKEVGVQLFEHIKEAANKEDVKKFSDELMAIDEELALLEQEMAELDSQIVENSEENVLKTRNDSGEKIEFNPDKIIKEKPIPPVSNQKDTRVLKT